MIKGLNISKKYKKFELQPTSIEIDKGEIVALIGVKQRSTKTTLRFKKNLETTVKVKFHWMKNSKYGKTKNKKILKNSKL